MVLLDAAETKSRDHRVPHLKLETLLKSEGRMHALFEILHMYAVIHARHLRRNTVTDPVRRVTRQIRRLHSTHSGGSVMDNISGSEY